MQVSLIETGSRSAALNMGIDEAILEAVALGEREPTLRLYGWEPRAISVGYFQSLEEEVDLDACARRGVDVVRRSTGGGAVYHAAELTYSIVIPETHALVPASILDSYRVLCHGVIEGLSLLGLHASFAPINDIVLDGRKISGNAQTRKRGCVLQHGTILLEVDVDAMFELLKVPQEKLRGKLISEVKERVSSVSRALGRSFGYAEALEPFAQGFAKALGVQLSPEPLSAALLARGELIAREKFAQPDWTRKR